MTSLNGLRNKCYLGILAAGGIAGTCEQAWQNQNPVYNFFLGLIMVCLTSFAGGFAGYCLKHMAGVATGRPAHSDQNGHGLLMGALSGAVLGTLLAALLSSGMPTALGCAAGSFLGAFLGALPDATLSPILRMIHEREEAIRPKPLRANEAVQISDDTLWTIGCYGGKVRITDSKEEDDNVQNLRLRSSEREQVPEDAQGDGACP